MTYLDSCPAHAVRLPARRLERPRRGFILLAAALLIPLTLSSTPQPAQAQEAFIGEIRMFAGNFAPRGWALCDGQLLQISSYSALFSILGTTYGGDGRTTFGLPDLRGRVALHPGGGAGLTLRRLGERSGTESTVLTIGQMPSHSHLLKSSGDNGSAVSPAGLVPAKNAAGVPVYGPPTSEHMADDAIEPMGGNQAHDNMQPWLGVNYIIALTGLFPSRN
jgi:microcystin-dependent protein